MRVQLSKIKTMDRSANQSVMLRHTGQWTHCIVESGLLYFWPRDDCTQHRWKVERQTICYDMSGGRCAQRCTGKSRKTVTMYVRSRGCCQLPAIRSFLRSDIRLDKGHRWHKYRMWWHKYRMWFKTPIGYQGIEVCSITIRTYHREILVYKSFERRMSRKTCSPF